MSWNYNFKQNNAKKFKAHGNFCHAFFDKVGIINFTFWFNWDKLDLHPNNKNGIFMSWILFALLVAQSTMDLNCFL